MCPRTVDVAGGVGPSVQDLAGGGRPPRVARQLAPESSSGCGYPAHREAWVGPGIDLPWLGVGHRDRGR